MNDLWSKLWPFGPLVRSDLGPDRRAAAADALDDPYFTKVEDATVAEYVLAQIKSVVDLKLASMRALESKAAQSVGFAGTITAVVGVFGRTVPGPLLQTTVGLLILSIVLNLRGMAIREDELPSPSLYNSARVATNPMNKARIAIALAEAYTGYSLDIQHEAGIKARWINLGSAVFIAGLAALLLVAFQPNTSTLANPTQLHVTATCYNQSQRGSNHGRKAPAATPAARHAAPR